jgi:hypothetical protein
MQAGFARYGQERLLFRAPGAKLPPVVRGAGPLGGIRPCQPLDALPLARLYAAVTPPPVARLEAYRLADWERQGSSTRVPRSSLAPILRFADVEAYVQEAPEGPSDRLAALLQVGVAREDQPHYLKIMARPGADLGPLVGFGLGLIRRPHRAGRQLPRQRRSRARSNLRIADRSPPRGSRVLEPGDGYAAHEGSRRPCRRTGAGSGSTLARKRRRRRD